MGGCAAVCLGLDCCSLTSLGAYNFIFIPIYKEEVIVINVQYGKAELGAGCSELAAIFADPFIFVDALPVASFLPLCPSEAF